MNIQYPVVAPLIMPVLYVVKFGLAALQDVLTDPLQPESFDFSGFIEICVVITA